MFKKYIVFIIYLTFYNLSYVNSTENFSNYKEYALTKSKFTLQKVTNQLNFPWAITFIDNDNLIITEKNGGLYQINKKTGQKQVIKHNIQHIGYTGNGGQGGFLDAYFNSKDGFLYFTYSHDFKDIMPNKKLSKVSSTAIARGKLNKNEIKELEILLIAKPKQLSNKHFGSRIAIKNNFLYVTFGERGKGMISQDPTKHPGSIIRIKTNGKIPTDNPKFTGKKEWLPEIYAIGVRNPQGITVSPHNNKIYFSNHGPRGGDHIAQLKSGANYGWKDIAWGGTKYSGFSIGKVPFKKKYNKPIKTWVPSIAISSIQFYNGDVFPEWKGDLIVCSLSGKSLIRLDYEDNKIVDEEIIFKNKIGRIRDFKVDKEGNIFLINDRKNAELWKLTR